MKAAQRFLAPEVVQTSAMDCGPASLKCLLEGFGIGVGYDRLREACQTDVDGTSIDTMEEVANQLGLEAEQVMLPPDHLFVPEANALPAILVVANALGMTHFIVVWRAHGSWLQVMDPAAGRHWVRRKSILRDVYRHTQAVPAAAWREWAGSEEFRTVLDARMAALGLGRKARRRLFQRASEDAGWHSAAALDAAVRMASSIVDSGGLPAGRAAAALVENVFGDELDEAADEPIPELYWSVRPTTSSEEGEERLGLRGAVLVRVTGKVTVDTEAGEHGDVASERRLSPELAAALTERSVQPARELWRTLTADGYTGLAMFVAALATASAVTVFQVLFFRGLLDIGLKLVLPEQRLAAASALALFLLLAMLIELPAATGVLRLGRRLEVRLRQRFLEKTARLADRYFRSRLASDMAERSHNTHMLHEVPEVGATALRLIFQAVLTVAGIIWLDPGVALVAVLALAASIGVPLAAQPLLTETDLRVRNHAGALSRYYLDALLGLVPARNHGAERPMRRAHESLLVEWRQALLRSERAKLWVDGVQMLSGYGLAIWLVFRHLSGSEGVGHVLLLAYWALHLQVIGENLAVVGRQVPHYRNITRRLLEPLGMDEVSDVAPEDGAPIPRDAARRLQSPTDSGVTASDPIQPVAARTARRHGVAVSFEGVRVVAGGHLILDDVDLEIEPGSHVAVVGPSGAGKSSLLGLLLGWHQASVGTVRIDGETLDAARLSALREEAAWVDPAIQLWNRSLLANLRYGSRGTADHRIGGAIDTARLRELLEKLPKGLQSPLGEGGALVSGGEGQRVRLARALLRPEARLVVLDEPFRGLDRTQRRRLTQRARDWWLGSTLFYVSHDLAETQAFDRVLVLEGGRVTEKGWPAELASAPDSRYAALLRAEERVRRELEQGASWRRWRVEAGKLREVGRAEV
ncbi:MAG: ATP-binding cassette domain-containing protein [bacterium]|nr:ATP-binding cassette domain-containing protein [bacterium]